MQQVLAVALHFEMNILWCSSTGPVAQMIVSQSVMVLGKSKPK